MQKRVKNQTGLFPSALGAALRLAYFLVCIAIVGFALCTFVVLPLRLLSFVRPSFQADADGMMCRGVGWLMRLQFWLDSRVEIQAPSGNPGLLLVSNHRSHLDVFLLLSRVRGIRILAKSSLFRIPFLGLMMRASKQIPVDRGNLGAFVQAMDEVRRRLRQGETVHVFPEMTRCPEGHQGLLPFSTAPFHAALQEGAVVLPLVIEGTDSYWPRKRWGVRAGAGARVRSLRALRARDFENADQLKGEVQSQILGALL